MDELAGFMPAAAPRRRFTIILEAVRWQTLLSFLLPFTLYLRTLAPTIYNLDSAELTTAAATGGILRATGYPLYLLLGRFWSLLPVGDVGYRLNLFSAFCGALTILLLDLCLRRLYVGRWARLGALGLLACAPYFWHLSLIAEVYTLHTALMAGLILASLRWREQPSPRRLALIALLLVLSLAHHAATVLLLPGLLIFLSSGGRSLLQWRAWRLPLAAGLAAASVFLVLPLRYLAAPAFNYAGVYNAQGIFMPVNVASLQGLLWLVTGRAFAGQMFGYTAAAALQQLADYGVQLWQAFFAVGIGPGLLGAALLWRRDRLLSAALLGFFLANVLFYANYRVVDKVTMYLPTYVIWTLWLGLGLQELLRWLQGTRWLRPAHAFLAVVLLLAVAWNWPRVDLSGDWSARRQGEQILDDVAPNALVVGWWDTVPVVHYLQFVEGRRSDVLAINRFLISSENLEQLIRNEAPHRPVYINSPPPELLRAMHIQHAGELYRLTPIESDRTQGD